MKYSTNGSYDLVSRCRRIDSMDRQEIARLRGRRAVRRATRHKRAVRRALRKAEVAMGAAALVIVLLVALVLELT